MSDVYARLLALLDSTGAEYRLIDHPPEGRTEIVSAMRGHPAAQAAKCLVLIAKRKKLARYVLAVVPGDMRVDLEAVKQVTQSTYVSVANAQTAMELTGSVMGGVTPFALDPGLELIADPALLRHEELYTNAGRLDRSVAIRTRDYVRLAKPRLERIGKSAGAPYSPLSFDGVRMRAVGTGETGQVDRQTLFVFSQSGSTVSAQYSGGAVELGHLVGRVSADGLVFRYCQVDRQGEVHGGRSRCSVGRLPDGRIRLQEHFHWESREGGGTNVLEQVEGRFSPEGLRCT